MAVNNTSKNIKVLVIWYAVWSIILLVFSIMWFYKAFDTARMLDYLLAFVWLYGSVAFAFKAEKLHLNRNKKGALKKQTR
jgi:hypothetical protein